MSVIPYLVGAVRDWLIQFYQE